MLADDHDMFRTALRQLLEEQRPSLGGGRGGDRRRCGHAGARARARRRRDGPGDAGFCGVEATRRIIDEAPHTSVVVLTVSEEASDVVDAIVAGACGYLLKSASIDELIAGIRSRPPPATR